VAHRAPRATGRAPGVQDLPGEAAGADGEAGGQRGGDTVHGDLTCNPGNQILCKNIKHSITF